METSALLTWLLGEPRRDQIAASLDEAGDVVTSSLTFLEARRALNRLAHLGMAPDDVDRLATTLDALRDEWLILPIHEALLHRAARRFPVEPVRSLDAIHLASAELLRELHGQTIRFVALDGRVRVNAVALGVEVDPPG